MVRDICVLNDTRCDPPRRYLGQWDCLGLRTAVHVEGEVNARKGTDKYWNCEMAIPFREMHAAANIPPQPGDCWRVNLYRIDRGARGDEDSAWSPVGDDFHAPERFGDLVFA